MSKRKANMPVRVSSLQFFSKLAWLDGTPLMDHIEPYRRALFTQALDTFRPDGSPAYTTVLSGRAKKNAKTLDLVLAALFVLVIRRSLQGSDGYILANDQDQAADDLGLARKLVAQNPDLRAEIECLRDQLRLRDGTAALRILPAKDVAGAHGKTYAFVGFDEIHAYRDWALLEALAPDPTRGDTLTWVTSYASIYNVKGAPLHDLMVIGKAGADPRMLFSWYSGDYTSDPRFADMPPEERANPSRASWADAESYLSQQRSRLPTARFRRLHLNLPGAPEGAAFDQAKIMAAVVAGRQALAPEDGVRYRAFVDMSGGSSDDAVLAVAHLEGRVVIVDRVEKQPGGVPFDPRSAVRKFVGILREYKIASVTGDAFAGQTFRSQFEAEGISYERCGRSKSDLYELLEPVLNAGEVELLDQSTLIEQLVCLVWRGARIDHEVNGHDDHANGVAGVVNLFRARAELLVPAMMTSVASGSVGDHPEIARPGAAGIAAHAPARSGAGVGGSCGDLRHLGIF